MRACIATGDYFRPGETFVNRHIEHLFGGETCIVTGRYHGEDPIGRPIFERRRKQAGADLAIAPYWLLRNTMVHGTSRIPFGRAKADLAAFWRDNGVQVVLSEFGTQALAVAPLARELGLPCFTYFRGTDASKQLRRPRIVNAYGKMFPLLTGVFSVSQFLLDNLAQHGLSHPTARVIPSGVNTDLFQPETKQKGLVLALGRFIEKKAPLTTLRAFAEAAADLPHARLEMIGDGPLLEPARALATELGVAHRVNLPGRLPHAEVRERLARAEIFAQHSVTAADGNTEGLPTAIQEALACGCAILSTRHAGIPEAVDEGANGLLVDEHDAAGYTKALHHLLTTPDLPAMSTAARETATSRFDNRMLLSQLETAIKDRVAAS